MLKTQEYDWRLLPNYNSYLFETTFFDYSFLIFFFIFTLELGSESVGKEESRKQWPVGTFSWAQDFVPWQSITRDFYTFFQET